MKTKIYVDDYDKSPEGYDSLSEAIAAMEGRFFGMPDLIRYNLPLRDKVRELGVDEFINWFVDEVPELRNDARTINMVRESLEKHPIGELDCRYMPKNEPFEVCGVKVASLQALRDATCCYVDMYVHSNHDKLYYATTPKQEIPGLTVVQSAELYPCFDAEDRLYENRYYRDFLVSTEPIEEDRLTEFCKLRSDWNYNKVSETLPPSMLPLIFYNGDDRRNNFFILATPR